MSSDTTTSSENQKTLRPNSIGLPGVLFQSVTTMAPASAVSFSLVAALPYAGASLPLAVFIALIVCAFIALNIGELAKHLPSAGGYFTYVSRSLGVQAGWMVGWLFDLAYLMIVPLAEETQNPRRTVPRAVLLSTLIIGIFYVFCSYAGIVNWGISKMPSYAADPNPWGTLAIRAWGPLNFIVILAILNSALANANGGVNAAARVLYAMGRIGTLPTALAHTNRFRVPDVAIIFTMIIALVGTFVPGLLYGTTSAFAFIGTIITIPIILVYIATCISVPLFYRREHPAEFNVLRHIILPIIPVLVLLAVIYSQVVPLLIPPYPAAPISYAVPIVAIWFVIGLIIVVVLSTRMPETLAKSSKVYTEAADL